MKRENIKELIPNLWSFRILFMIKKIKLLPLELLFFTAALIDLFFANATNPQYILCPLKILKLNFCPGCGLGHALHYLMHGKFKLAWQTHYLAFLALPVLVHRICLLTYKFILK